MNNLTVSSSRSTSERIVRCLMISLELTLIAVVVRMFHVEEHRHLFPMLCVASAGFVIHTWLPHSWRMGFFALLSATCILLVLGATNGGYLLITGTLLIGVCYLPVRNHLRTGLLIAAGAALAYFRTAHPFPLWPILGSMFMFRLACFVYDCRRLPVMPSPAVTLSYFFMLPNVCFPLFPVIDFRKFGGTWYDEDEWQIYQTGIKWMIHGLGHLLLYRFLRFSVVPEFREIQDIPQLMFFMGTNYALYLQVSGQFHLIAGVLHLFGFNIGRTHYLYFLASGCSDIWRRINIFWKDFMTKFFFFPSFFFLRAQGASTKAAIVLSIFCVFVCTWLLHSWQTFWILGRFPISVSDASLWLGAGLCVSANALWESRGKKRRGH
jgi:hypothetical protein